MRLAFLGTPKFALPTLEALMSAGHDVACVYSQPPAPSGRGRAWRDSPVAAWARAHDLPLRTPTTLAADDEISAFTALRLDAAVVVAFGQILRPPILAAPALGCFNVHASLLPRWRGAAPIQRAVMAGDAQTGVSVMRMTAGLDEGPVLAQTEMPIGPSDTAGAVHDRLCVAGAALMARTLACLQAGRVRECAQPQEGATYARKIRASETRLDFRRPAREVDGRIRGLSPHPGAWFCAPSPRGPVRIKALLSQAEGGEAGEPGAILDAALLVACGEGAVRILELQREGRGAQTAAEFLRGFPLPPGARLE